MNVDSDDINFLVKILRAGPYDPNDLDITATFTLWNTVDVLVNPETPDELDDITADPGTATDVSLTKTYVNVMDVGHLDVTVTLNTIKVWGSDDTAMMFFPTKYRPNLGEDVSCDVW